jgi:hypothetical protein
MITFTTTNNFKYSIDIKTKDILAVKKLVQYSDGRAVDILEAAETGTLAEIYGDIETLVNVVFVLCIDQIKEYFDVQKYDELQQKTYQLMPEFAGEPALTKASRWFGSVIDGNTLMEIIETFKEAVVNFTPNENRRRAMQAILVKERETQKLEAEYRIKVINKIFEEAKTTMDNRWENVEKMELQNLEKILDTLSNLSGNTPE